MTKKSDVSTWGFSEALTVLPPSVIDEVCGVVDAAMSSGSSAKVPSLGKALAPTTTTSTRGYAGHAAESSETVGVTLPEVSDPDNDPYALETGQCEMEIWGFMDGPYDCHRQGERRANGLMVCSKCWANLPESDKQ